MKDNHSNYFEVHATATYKHDYAKTQHWIILEHVLNVKEIQMVPYNLHDYEE